MKNWKQRFKEMYLGMGYKTQGEYAINFLNRTPVSLSNSLNQNPFPKSMKDLIRTYEHNKKNSHVVFYKK